MNYFSTKEIECKCGCGIANIDDRFLAKLNMLRHLIGKPLTLSSACRCQEHNKNVGGVATSLHITTADKAGTAVDVRCSNKALRYEIVEAAVALRFTGIGVHKSFIHLSNNDTVKEGVFLY